MKISLQSGTQGTGSQKLNWVLVTAVDSKTGAAVNGTVTIVTNRLLDIVKDTAGHPRTTSPPFTPGKGAAGPTGKKLVYQCGSGVCTLTVQAHGYANEVTELE